MTGWEGGRDATRCRRLLGRRLGKGYIERKEHRRVNAVVAHNHALSPATGVGGRTESVC